MNNPFSKAFPWEVSGSLSYGDAKVGSIEYYKRIFPAIFDKDEDYEVFVKYYNDHPEIHQNESEIDLIKTKFVKK